MHPRAQLGRSSWASRLLRPQAAPERFLLAGVAAQPAAARGSPLRRRPPAATPRSRTSTLPRRRRHNNCRRRRVAHPHCPSRVVHPAPPPPARADARALPFVRRLLHRAPAARPAPAAAGLSGGGGVERPRLLSRPPRLACGARPRVERAVHPARGRRPIRPPPWTFRRLVSPLRPPERSLSSLEARRGLRSPPQAAPTMRIF